LLRKYEKYECLSLWSQYIQFKAGNYDRWLGGMRKLRRKIIEEIGSTRLEDMHKLV